MNFLEMVKAVRLLSGMQGIGPSSTSSTQGVDTVVVEMVRISYKDIQTYREDWNWLEKEATFTTTKGKTSYTLDDIFGSLNVDLKSYKDNSFFIRDTTSTSSMCERSFEEVWEKSLQVIPEGKPSIFAVDTSNNSILLQVPPDKAYTIIFRYYIRPEILLNDTDVPLLPVSFHDLIVYKALEKMSIYLKIPELYAEYSNSTATMMGQLMRATLKPKRIRTRPLA